MIAVLYSVRFPNDYFSKKRVCYVGIQVNHLFIYRLEIDEAIANLQAYV